MSLLDDVSIVVTPNGYKSGVLYSVIPSSGAGDLEVVRGTAATRVDEAGLVNYAEIIGSEEVTNGDFATDSDWTKGTGWTISGGTANSDGTSGLLSQTSPALTSGKIYKWIFEITSYTSGSVKIYSGSGSDDTAYKSAIGTFTQYFIANNTGKYFYSNSFNGSIDNVSVKEVTRDNVPRIDYTGGGCPHILAEPQRTNLVTYSEDFSQFSSSSIVLTTGQLAPDGSLNATKISGTIGVSSLYRGSASTTTATRSIYAKTVSGTGTARLTSYNANTNNLFNLTEEWQRFDLTGSISTGATNFYAADFRGSQTLSEFIIWGGQSEEGSYPTSLIPTSGSTVTRNQDQFSRDGIGSLINDSEGTLFLEMAKFQNATNFGGVELNDTTNNNSITIYTRNDNSSVTIIVRKSGSQQWRFDFNTGVNTYDFNSYAIRFSSNNFSLWFNGNKVGEQLSGDTPLSLSNITLDAFQGGDFEGKVKQLQVYKTALTDDNLALLTA